MKRKLFGWVLPMSAFIALTGTGFGVWVFNETQADIAGTKLVLTNAVAAENLDATSAVTLTLDQVTKPAYDGSAADGESDIASGAVTVKTDLKQVLGGYSDKTTDATNYGTLTENAASTEKFTLTYTINTVINGDLAQWIKYKDDGATINKADADTTTDGAISETADAATYTADYTATVPATSAVAAFEWYPEFEWIKTPATLQEWTNMKTNIQDNSSIVFNISFTKTA